MTIEEARDALRQELSDLSDDDVLHLVEEMKLLPVRSLESLLARVTAHALNGCRYDAELTPRLYDILCARRETTANIVSDLLSTFERDQACTSLLEALLFRKGFQALCAYRAARAAQEEGRTWFAKALWHRASVSLGIDIHPGAHIEGGVVLDHGTGVVIGETTTIESGCYLFHGVTLGSTGAGSGTRHPTIRRGAFLGAGATVLGSVEVGEGAVVAAGSVVLRSVAPRRLVGGAPARDLGEAPTLLPPLRKRE